MKIKLYIPLLLGSFLLSTTAYSQEIPSAVEPGALDRKYTEEPQFKLPGAIDLPKASQKAALPEGSEEIKLTPSKITVQGNTVYSSSDLSQYFNNVIGKEITLSKIFKIADEITDHYQKNGYLLSFAVVPAQRIAKTSEVTITVVEGFIDKVSFEGSKNLRSSLLEKWKKKITSQKLACQ